MYILFFKTTEFKDDHNQYTLFVSKGKRGRGGTYPLGPKSGSTGALKFIVLLISAKGTLRHVLKLMQIRL